MKLFKILDIKASIVLKVNKFARYRGLQQEVLGCAFGHFLWLKSRRFVEIVENIKMLHFLHFTGSNLFKAIEQRYKLLHQYALSKLMHISHVLIRKPTWFPK